MKKVRYAAGVLGAVGVMPALGLMTPAAHAVTNTTRGLAAIPRAASASSSTITTPVVSSTIGTSASSATAAKCNARHKRAQSVVGPYETKGYIAFSRDNGCIDSVVGHFIGSTPSGYDMRVRFYPAGLYAQKFVTGTKNTGSISFRWNPPNHKSVTKVCEAIVSNNNTNVVIGGGPVCESTGF